MIWRDDHLLAFMDKVPVAYATAGGISGAVLATVSANPLSATATIATIILVVMKAVAEAPRVWRAVRWMFRK